MAVKRPALILQENDVPPTENLWVEMAELEPEIMYQSQRPNHELQMIETATIIKDNRGVYVEYNVGADFELIRRDYPDLTVEEVIAIVKDWEVHTLNITD